MTGIQPNDSCNSHQDLQETSALQYIHFSRCLMLSIGALSIIPSDQCAFVDAEYSVMGMRWRAGAPWTIR